MATIYTSSVKTSAPSEFEIILQGVQVSKIMTISYTEEILANNFNIIMSCLKNQNK